MIVDWVELWQTHDRSTVSLTGEGNAFVCVLGVLLGLVSAQGATEGCISHRTYHFHLVLPLGALACLGVVRLKRHIFRVNRRRQCCILEAPSRMSLCLKA